MLPTYVVPVHPKDRQRYWKVYEDGVLLGSIHRTPRGTFLGHALDPTPTTPMVWVGEHPTRLAAERAVAGWFQERYPDEERD